MPLGVKHVRVLRDGRLIDDFRSRAGSSYIDHLLWPSSTYSYEVQGLDGRGIEIYSKADTVTTPRPRRAVRRMYGRSSPWNQPIRSTASSDENSVAMVAAGLVAYRRTANFAKDNRWGISLAYADPVSKRYSIGCTKYGCRTATAGRIPRYAEANSGSDGKLSVIDLSAGTELDMWRAAHNPIFDVWSAASRYSSKPFGRGFLCGHREHCGGPNAAGSAGMAGVVRPEEIAQGHIDHALAIATPHTRRGYIACPATSSDGEYTGVTALPEGARIQLDPSFDVDATAWPAWKKVIAKALQSYGAIVEDTGGSLSLSGESTVNRGYDAWAKAGVSGSASLSDFPWNRFRTLRLDPC